LFKKNKIHAQTVNLKINHASNSESIAVPPEAPPLKVTHVNEESRKK